MLLIHIKKSCLYKLMVENSVYERQWCKIIKNELSNLQSYTVWFIESLFDRQKIVEYKWIFKIKYNEKEWVTKFKTRLVTQNFSQIYKINYQKRFTSIIHKESLRMFLVLMTLYNLKLHQMNVKVTYLLRNLKSKKKSIYMCISKNV